MRIAILGCGSIGRRHLSNLQTLGFRDLLAFDPVALTRTTAAADYGVAVCATLAEVWDARPNVVLVTAPPQFHIPLALEAVRHGCHLFSEKPLSHTLDGVHTLLLELESSDLVAMVACNMRFHPGPGAIKRLLTQGAIGELIAARIQTGSFLPRWRPQQNYRDSYSASPSWGGAVLDCIHEIDLALWYFGPANVAGMGMSAAKSLGLQTDGLAEIILRHESGVLSNVHLNFVQREYRRTCQIIGSEGTIYWDFADHRVQVFGPNGTLDRTIGEPPGWEANQMYVDEMKHFLHAVETHAPVMNSLEEGIAALKIALTVRAK
jgi:predicted dehydrogenase